MKLYFTLSFCCFLSSLNLLSQTVDTLQLDPNSIDLPMLLPRGKTYTVQSDSVFAINAKRWQYYAKLEALKKHNSNIKDTDVAFLDMVQHYQQIVDSCEYYFRLLQKNADNTQDKSEVFLKETQKTIQNSMSNLNAAKVNLDTASSRLTQAETHLTTAIKEIKAAKKRHLWQKIGIGVGSFAIGFIVGVFVK
jgi:hypothetical protein